MWIYSLIHHQIAKFMGPTWGPPGSCRPQMGPMLAPWTLLSGSPKYTCRVISYLIVLCDVSCIQALVSLTHWGRMTHICVSKVNIIGSDNGLSPGCRQAIIWTNAGMLLIGPLGTKFSEILSEMHTFSFNKMHLKMSPGKWRPFCLGLNVLTLDGVRRRIVMGWYECLDNQHCQCMSYT